MQRRWAILGIVILGMLALAVGPAAAQGKIVIYAAEDEKTTNALTAAFTEPRSARAASR